MPGLYQFVSSQREVEVEGRRYLLDYEIGGSDKTFAIELDGYGPHSGRVAFSHDRMRQNDLASAGRVVVRFSYDSIRNETARCVRQLQALLSSDPLLANFVVADPVVALPEMDPDPLYALKPSPTGGEEHMQAEPDTYFDTVRHKLNKKTLRECHGAPAGGAWALDRVDWPWEGRKEYLWRQERWTRRDRCWWRRGWEARFS